MPNFRIDFHVHTRFSPDALASPEKLWHACRSAGLDGFAITDHDRTGAYERLVRLGLADPSGQAVDGVLVIPGVEVSCLEGHVLVLGAGWNAEPGTTAAEAVAKARRLGALAIAAHPMERSRSGVGRRTLDSVVFDGIEGHNSKTLERRANLAAEAYAADHRLPVIAGSDSHFACTMGRAHTIVDAEELSVDAVLAGVRAGRTELVRGLHTKREIARYLVRGWLTRPWLIDLAKRRGRARWAKRLAGRGVLMNAQGLPSAAVRVFDGVEVMTA